MDDLDRYNELDNIVSTIRALLTEIETQYDKEVFQGLLLEYEQELDALEERLEEEAERDRHDRQREYWADQF